MSENIPEPTSSNNIFIGRQPILDRDRELFAYELLFRGGFKQDMAVFDDPNAATATVLHNVLMGFGIEEVTGGKKAFVNFPVDFFDPDAETIFSPKDIVIEVLEDVPVNDTVIEAIKRFKAQKFLIALDDFVFKREFIPFLQQADIIKLDIESVKLKKIPTLFEKIRKVTKAKLLAERVETQEQFDICYEAGADYFQGYFFAKPQILTSKKLSVSKIALMQLLEKIADENIALGDLTRIVEQDIGLMHKVMKLANSYRTVGMPAFEDFTSMMLLFGIKRVQSWVVMLSMSSIEGMVPEVYNTARIRAIFMRQYAIYTQQLNPDSFYMAGMLSMLEAVLEIPLEEALEQVPITDEIKLGLLHEEGAYGEALQQVKLFEAAKAYQAKSQYRALYLEAMKEAADLNRAIQSA